MGIKKLPTVKSLQAEYAGLLTEKKKLYPEYAAARQEIRERLNAKNTAELPTYGCPEKSAWVFSPVTYWASARKSVPKERAASSVKALFWRIGSLPNKQFCSQKQRTLPFGSVLLPALEICNYLRAPPSTAAVFADRSSHRFSLANSWFCGRMISYASSRLSLNAREDVLSPKM